MARIRSVKPEYWTSEQVMHMSRDARLLFIGLWNFCDDNGIHPASALTLKAQVFPADLLTADQVMAFVDEMIEQGLVEEYEAGGRAFWRVTGWHSHQRIEYPTFRHPTGDAESDTGDAADAGDTKGDGVTCVTPRVYKRLGGKQRQIVLRKLRERDGDKCSVCDSASNLSILSLALGGEENVSDISNLRLICSTCKRARKQGDRENSARHQRVTSGDVRVVGGDSTTERKGKDRKGEESPKSPKPPGGGLAPTKERAAIVLQTFLDECRANDERPVRDYSPLWRYAEEAGLPQDFVALAWVEFCRRFLSGGTGASKRYKDWRQAFRKYVEGNYLKLWAIDGAGAYFLTTLGKQAQKIHESKEAAAA